MLYIGSESTLRIKRAAGRSARPASITRFAERTKEISAQTETMGEVEIKAGPGTVRYMVLEIAGEGSGFDRTA